MRNNNEIGVTRENLMLSANIALVGEIRPNMRRIYVDYKKEDNKIMLYFFYDTLPTEEDLNYDVEGVIITEMSCFFSDDVEWGCKSYVVPYPQRIEHPSDICVYGRYEKYPNEN